jgi:hypothetical protein
MSAATFTLSDAVSAAQGWKASGFPRSTALISLKQFGDYAEKAIKQVYDGEVVVLELEKPAPASAAVSSDPMPDFPASLKVMPRWVRWKIAQVNGRMTKVPYTVDGRMAASTRSEDWTTYEQAVTDIRLNEKSGVGFVVNGDIVGVDIDGCRNPETGEITEWAQSIIDSLDSYTEITPSKTGVRVWVRGTLPQKKNRFSIDPSAGYGDKVGVECYSDARYFTCTGECIQLIPTDVLSRDLIPLYTLLEKIQEQHPVAKKMKTDAGTVTSTPTVQIEKLGQFGTSKYDIFMRGDIISASPFVIATPLGKLPYPSQSEADFAFATVLAYHHNGDTGKMATDFRASKSMYREKWNRLEESTFQKVLASIDLTDEKQTIPNIPPIAATPDPEITEEEVAAALDEEYPVIPFGEYSGPMWDDDWMHGIAGDITKKAAKYCEAHPAGMYLDFLVSIGNIIGRGPYFNTSATRHYTNEFMIRVGNTATARKGTGRDAVDEPLKLVDPNWFTSRVMSGFGSGEAIVHQIADSSIHQVRDKKVKGQFTAITKPGVADKRLCVREGEAASIYQLAGKKESRADIIIRDGWDGKPLKNIVKGATDGVNNSAQCQEPLLSISGDTTRSELIRRLPEGSDQNGFGNRFLYCYVQRVKLCPLGGPPIDWSGEVAQLHEIIAFARGIRYVPFTRAAAKVWVRMYTDMEQELGQMPTLSQAMCSRGVAHVRRLALIFALLDKAEAVDTAHLHAAKRIWDYCQESARFIFDGTTKDQERIVSWVARQQRAVTVREVTDGLFHRHHKVTWVKSQLDGLVGANRLIFEGEAYSIR